MALINCPECNHLMSENAAICPNCNKPRSADRTKKCTNCGTEIGSRKKKCPECQSIQTTNNSISTMKNTNNQSNNYLGYFIALLIGTGSTYFAYPIINPSEPTVVIEQPYEKDAAKVQKVNGLYVFVESFPKEKEAYKVIEVFEGDDIIEKVNSLGIGKENAGKVLVNIFNLATDNINFHEQLFSITKKIKNEFPDAQGVIFSNKIRKCEIITFIK